MTIKKGVDKMIAMQYKITLPSDYDMNIIKERVEINGYKTDGFEGLKFKLYLVTEKGKNDNFQNSYCPLYIWNDTKGMNKFLFEGYYDNILNSFGWQSINTGVILADKTSEKIQGMKYIFEIVEKITPCNRLDKLIEKIEEEIPNLEDVEYVIIHSPDKWEYRVYYFLDSLDKIEKRQGNLYEILHISQ